MKACTDREESLVARAAGTLSREEDAALQAHLAGCSGCRAELAALDATVNGLALPPLDAHERALEIEVAPRVLRALEKPRRRWVWTASMAGAVAAALVGVVVVNGVRGRREAARAAEITDADLEALEDWALAEDPLPEDPAAAGVPESFGEL